MLQIAMKYSEVHAKVCLPFLNSTTNTMAVHVFTYFSSFLLAREVKRTRSVVMLGLAEADETQALKCILLSSYTSDRAGNLMLFVMLKSQL